VSGDIAVRHASINLSAEWRDVPLYEGRYRVSDEGQVVAVGRTYTDAWGRTVRRRARLLRPSVEGGYLRVCLHNGESQRSWRVHRLVMLAFAGPAPTDKPEVCHNNGDPSDNRFSNLRWGSHADNMQDKHRHGTEYWSKRTHCPQGHAYDEANTWINPRGARVCRACLASKARQRRARMRGAA
jgi:hypothetical protein